MKTFPIVETAFSGYRLLAARPSAGLIWFAFQLLIVFGMTALTVAIAGPEMTALQEMRAAGGAPDPATTMALSGKVMVVGLVSMLLSLVTNAIALAAVARAVLRPGEKGFGYLRFGADELRLLVVILVIGIFLYIAYMVAFGPAMGVLFAVAGPMQAAMAMQGSGALPANAIAMAALAAIPGALLMIFLAVKLSLAPAQTVGERAIQMFGSWKLTKGMFWRTLGTYALAAIPVILLAVVVVGVAFAVAPGGFKGLMQPNVSSMAAAFGATQILVHVLSALLRTLIMGGLMAPPVAIYASTVLRSNEAAVDAFGDDDDDDDD